MRRRMSLFPATTTIEKTPSGDCLAIAGCHISELAARYGTPLYLYDAHTLDATVRAYRQPLVDFYPGEAGLTYAGKAFLCVALAQWTQRHDLWIDCTGRGELHIAAAAGVAKDHILLHGVNKSEQVLAAGIAQAGTIVVDNLMELERLVTLAAQVSPPLPHLWLRFRPGTAVETHSHIQTGQEESKFGMGENEIEAAAQLCYRHGLPLAGLHFHLGSQFRDLAPIEQALQRTLDLALALSFDTGWTLCPGGGWGVAYHEDDLPSPDVESYVRFVAEEVVDGCHRRGLPLPRLQLEPGRGLVARAGVAVYRVGTVKQTARRRWILLDGGLADNPRYALYRARYTALPVTAPLRSTAGAAWLAGPYCESGDILIEGLPFAGVRPGELVAVPASGAYQLSMASNYNGALRPAILWLEEGQERLIRERETAADLVRHDRPLAEGEPGLSTVPFCKYHGYGNDYLVASRVDGGRLPTPSQIRALCDRHRGFGADGLLLDCSEPGGGFAVRIFNADGSEAEKSGNGLAIFARYLWDAGRTDSRPFLIQTAGGAVTARVHGDGRHVTVEMGRARFDSQAIPVRGPGREVINETLPINGQELTYCAATLGNPHCVVLRDELSAAEARRWGPLIEHHSHFPNRTNVQFMKVIDRATIQIEIWERGSGYTLASGSSSCAAAAVAYRLGLCDANVTVRVPGGQFAVAVGEAFTVTLTSFVTKVWQGFVVPELFTHLP